MAIIEFVRDKVEAEGPLVGEKGVKTVQALKATADCEEESEWLVIDVLGLASW